MAKNGLDLMLPSSISYSGSSATISANGSVLCSGLTSLSMNGVFTSDYDNYMIVMRIAHYEDFAWIRLRSNGTDSTTGYLYQSLQVDTTPTGTLTSSSSVYQFAYWGGSRFNGNIVYAHGPALAQQTAFRSVTTSTSSNASIYDHAGIHTNQGSFDGLTISRSQFTFAGRIAIYGMND